MVATPQPTEINCMGHGTGLFERNMWMFEDVFY